MSLRNATAADVKAILADLRPEDTRELWKATGKPATEALLDLERRPYVAFTLCQGEMPVAIFGATVEADGSAWMFRFATTKWPSVIREAIKIGRRVMLPLFKQSGVKRLYAETLYESDTAWLRLFGAKKVGGRVDKNGTHFSSFVVDLAA